MGLLRIGELVLATPMKFVFGLVVKGGNLLEGPVAQSVAML